LVFGLETDLDDTGLDDTGSDVDTNYNSVCMDCFNSFDVDLVDDGTRTGCC
jgi:hypothetical protein